MISHFMTFSAVTEENSRLTAARYAASEPSADMSTAVPMRTPVPRAAPRRVSGVDGAAPRSAPRDVSGLDGVVARAAPRDVSGVDGAVPRAAPGTGSATGAPGPAAAAAGTAR